MTKYSDSWWVKVIRENAQDVADGYETVVSDTRMGTTLIRRTSEHFTLHLRNGRWVSL